MTGFRIRAVDWCCASALPLRGSIGLLPRSNRWRGLVAGFAALGPREIQCDYDCPQKRLDGYRRLLDALQASAGSIPVVPTTLPSWQDEPAFRKLVAGRPGYVLQVHSLQLPKQAGQPVVLFDPDTARAAARKAAALGIPFRIAMATYRL